MSSDAPQLASLAFMARADRKVLFVRHAAGPFAGRWSLPFIGVADVETAEDALGRLLREYLHVMPGRLEFLATVALVGSHGERFIANGFTCTDWQGEPKFPARLFDDAIWAVPSEAVALDLLPELRAWVDQTFPGGSTLPVASRYTAVALKSELADARGDLLAELDAMPATLRHDSSDAEGWSPLTILQHVAEVEAYYRNEVARCIAQPGRLWRQFNDDLWKDVHASRPTEEEPVLRERLDAVRADTQEWLATTSDEALNGYLDHPERGVVLAGERIGKIADHYRAHARQLREIAASTAQASDREGQP
ncbi:MAG: DinB family protein [Chloroflexi bacterium]|nr:DinB family protein [Chloroflexota bacterium]